MCKALSGPPQIFILLQYQTLAHRIKTNVLRADNLDSLNRTSAAAGKIMCLTGRSRQDIIIHGGIIPTCVGRSHFCLTRAKGKVIPYVCF